jgi:hypothetical protein
VFVRWRLEKHTFEAGVGYTVTQNGQIILLGMLGCSPVVGRLYSIHKGREPRSHLQHHKISKESYYINIYIEEGSTGV